MADIDLPVFPFLPNWQQGITETLEWVTDVLRSDISGHEQRRSVRLTPRRFFEARFNPIDDARSFMDLWLQRFGAQEFLLPLWHDRAKLSVGANAGSIRVAFDNTFREFETGGLALLRSGLFASEVVTIEGQDADGLDLAAPLVGTWPIGSVVYPLRPAELDNLQAVLAALTRNVGRTALSFRLTRDNPYPLGDETLSLYEGFPVVAIEPNRRDDLETRFEQMYAEADYRLGRVYRRTETDRAFAAQFYNWQARGRQQHHELRQTLYRLNGRQKAVWMPSFNKDVVLTRNLSSSSNRLDIREIGYRFLGAPIAGRDRIALLDNAGSRRIVRVTGTSSPLAAGEDRLNLSANAGFSASAGREGSFVDLVRLDQDRIEIEHYTDSDGVCEVAAAFRSFTQGRTTAGSLVQPFPDAEMSDLSCSSPAMAERSGCVAFFEGWHASARISLVGGSLAISNGFVNAGDGGFQSFTTGIDLYDDDGRPQVIWSGLRSVVIYFYQPESALVDEVKLQLQWGADTPTEQVGLTKVRFSYAAWDQEGGSSGGSTPKAESDVIDPGTPSYSTDNPMSIQRLFPVRWYFNV